MTDTAGSIVRVGADGRLLEFDRRFERATGLTPEVREQPLIEVLGSRLSPGRPRPGPNSSPRPTPRRTGWPYGWWRFPPPTGLRWRACSRHVPSARRPNCARCPAAWTWTCNWPRSGSPPRSGVSGLWTYDIAASTWRWHGGRAQLSPIRGGADLDGTCARRGPARPGEPARGTRRG
ncbi:hypothetical protein ACU686_43180 [Yinghuangia aomiensis]